MSIANADYKQLARRIFKPGICGQAGKIGKSMLSKPWFKPESFRKSGQWCYQGMVCHLKKRKYLQMTPDCQIAGPPTEELRALARRM